MTSAEFAAYVGAAAWLPQITTWLYKGLILPKLTIVPERHAEIGFTSYGAIFNLRMALSADRKDLIIAGFELDVTHQDGEKRVFRWSGIQEHLGETRDAAGVQQGQLMKDQLPIALKVGTLSLTERFIRFQEPRYEETLRPLMQNLVAHFNYLKRTDPNFVATTLNSKELLQVLDSREKSFWWKPGRYELRMRPTSPKRFALAGDRYWFELTAIDVDRLRQNIQTLRADMENTVRSNLGDFTPVAITWNWAYALLNEGQFPALVKSR